MIFGYLIFWGAPTICLLICLIIARKDHLVNYENQLRGVQEKRNSKEKYTLGVVYIVILMILIAYSAILSNSCSEGIDTIDELTIAQFNHKYTQYEGRNLGSEVRELLSTVINNNLLEQSTAVIITVEFGNDGEIITEKDPTHYAKGWTINSKIKSNKKYDVKFEYADIGLINKIKIKEVKWNG